MFPCSSIYQHFPLTNQTWTINDHDHDNNNSTTFQIDHDDHDQNPFMIISSSIQQQQHSSPHSHNIPSIFEDDGVMLSHLLSQQQFLSCCNNNIDSTTSCSRALGDEIGVVDPSRHGDNRKAAKNRKAKQSAAVVPPPRKRTAGKKDRHSKICTAQGLRDRRMRLSLQIARKFFDLQDMLGFDKASRTIDWLFTKSKTAIRELKDSLVPHKHHHHNLSSSNSTSDQCEAASRAMAKIIDECDDDDDDGQFISVPNRDMKKMRKVVARESRDKARARARERTRERMLERWRRSGSADTTISEAENHSANALELKGEEEIIMTCHSDSRPVVSRPDQAEPTDRFLPDYSPISQGGRVGVSTIGGANSEEDFLGLPDQNWDIFNCSSKTQPFCPKDMGNNVVRVQNPYPILTANSGGHFCSSMEQKPSSIKAPTSLKARNPSSAFVANTACGGCGGDDDGEQNPNPMFIMDDDDQQFDHHEQNLASSDFLAGSNVFCSLNF